MRTIDVVILFQEERGRNGRHHILIGSGIVGQVTATAISGKLQVIISLDVVSVTDQVSHARLLRIELLAIAIVLHNRDQTQCDLVAILVYTYQ